VLASILGIQFIVLIIVTIIINGELDGRIKEQSQSILEERVQSAALRVHNTLSRADRIAELVVEMTVSGQYTSVRVDRWERDLFRILLASPNVAGIQLVLSDGTEIHAKRIIGTLEYLTYVRSADEAKHPIVYRDSTFTPRRREMSSESQTDARTQEWFKLALDNLNQTWTTVEKKGANEQQGLITSKGFRLNDDHSGAVAVHFNVSTLSTSFLDSLQEPGQALLIMDRSGHVVAYSDGNIFLEDTSLGAIAEYGDTIPAQVFPVDLRTQDQVLSSTESLGPANYGANHLTILMPLGHNNLSWLIGMHTLETSLTGNLWASRDLVPILMFLAFLCTFLLAIPIAKWIIRPILDFPLQTDTAIAAADGGERLFPLPYREFSATRDTLSQEFTQRRMFQIAYERTFDFSSRGMARIDPCSYRFLHANARLCQLTAMSAEQLITRDLWSIVDKSHHQALEGLGQSIISDREFTLDVRLDSSIRSETWLKITALMIRNHTGNPDHALLVLDDITSARTAEDRLGELKRDLYHLGRVNVMGELAEGLAHELNQPLSAIIHDMDAVRYTLKADLADFHDVETILSDIDNHAMRAGDIIRGLRNLIRKDSGRKEVFDLAELLDQTCKLMAAEARQRGVQIVDQSSHPLSLLGNRSQLAQVLVNLIRNSIEALDRESGPAACLRVGYSSSMGKVELYVEDNGPGLPKGLDVFCKFQTTRSAGLGLGLSICKSLVEENGGTIVHEAVEPHGARFVITLNQESGTVQGWNNG
jgi:hypothetical protein